MPSGGGMIEPRTAARVGGLLYPLSLGIRLLVQWTRRPVDA